MVRGRKRSLNCSKCGVEKTPENTYLRASGLFMSECKTCSESITMARYRAKMSSDKLLQVMAQHEDAITKIKEELRRRGEA